MAFVILKRPSNKLERLPTPNISISRTHSYKTTVFFFKLLNNKLERLPMTGIFNLV
jgi:hypothetical protein